MTDACHVAECSICSNKTVADGEKNIHRFYIQKQSYFVYVVGEKCMYIGLILNYVPKMKKQKLVIAKFQQHIVLLNKKLSFTLVCFLFCQRNQIQNWQTKNKKFKKREEKKIKKIKYTTPSKTQKIFQKTLSTKNQLREANLNTKNKKKRQYVVNTTQSPNTNRKFQTKKSKIKTMSSTTTKKNDIRIVDQFF
ncbi:hypothetical protein RFI_19790 [Reticulomyxa filosa]|uniref:Uncharacterized protein n=1 Tax=Reticulomyxa filosa TaxID=46433 RepID=X6MVP6_RETFI|nr:hypothetical protein RFI_19790 [Reticulomyxa filosa]|eukprot:ETO17532.1 hypothetical protein RFI_19790 [Reticulomyxa filosa]